MAREKNIKEPDELQDIRNQFENGKSWEELVVIYKDPELVNRALRKE